MKKLKIGIAAAIVAIIAAVIIRINMNSTAEQKIVKEDLVTSNELVQNKLKAIRQEEEDGIPKPARGTKENPFIVVEIVPHECLGQFGYLIPGCEPIDMERLKKNDTLFMNSYGNMLCLDEPHVVELSQTQTYLLPDEVPLGAAISSYGGYGYEFMASEENYKVVNNDEAEWKKYWEQKEFEGYYERTKDKSGKFNLVKGQNGEHTFEWVGSDGDYKWVTKENVNAIATDYSQQQVWTTRKSNVYYKNENSISHSDELIRNVFGTTSDKIYKEVLVVTPDLFLEDKNLDLIKCTDMIYIHAGDSSGQAAPLWAKFNKEGREFVDKNGSPISQGEAAGMGFNNNDLPWDAVLEIMNRMSADERPALIMDNNTANLQHDSNLYKMLLMIRLYGPKMFKELFLDTGKCEEVAVGDDWTTGAVTKYGQKKTSWEYTDLYPEGYENYTEEQLAAFGVKCTNFLTNDADNESRWDMVEDNMYFYLGGQAFLRGFLNSDAYGTEHTKYTEEVYDYLEEYRDYTPEKVSPANIVEYLLQNTPAKRKLRILEVEPCNEFIYGSENWKAYYLSLMPWFGGNINDKNDLEVVTMPTWEFNSSIEDLNSEYDMIIFGAKQNESNGLNGYNDPLMNVDVKDEWGNQQWDTSVWPYVKKQVGLVYTSIGDKVASTEYFGQQNEVTVLIKPDASTRYSGTDITEKKLKEVQSFMNGGKPVVLDTKLANIIKMQGASFEKKAVDPNNPVNTDVIDKSSYMYQLVNLYKNQNAASPTMFVKNYYVASKLKKALAYENCRIEFVPVSDKDPGYPTEYSYTEDSEQCIDKDKVQYASRTFRYTFKVVGKTMATYGIDLFIDTNSDGIYKGSLKEAEEGVQGVSERVTGFTVTDLQGNAVNPRSLTANVTYVLTKKLDQSYQGIMPWKLEAFKMAEDESGNMTVANTSCRSSRINYSAVQAEKPKEIRVLLMDVTPDMKEPKEYFSQPGIDKIWWVAGDDNHPSSITNMVDTRTESGKKFEKYLSCVNEFDVELVWLDNSEWTKCFDNSSGDASAWIDYLNNGDVQHKTKTDKDDDGGFDMIILGFSDDCTYTNNEVFHTGFMDFINQGKGVIISHDMVRDTSQTKYLKTRYDNELRDLMGQRRFGADRVVWKEGTAGTYLNGEWVTLMHGNVEDPDRKASDTGGNYDLSSTGTTAEGTAVKLPGFFDNSNRLYLCYGDEDEKNDRVSDVKSDWPTLTNYANKVNSAQITSYPYAIPELLEIAYTHAQNYQLDLETDARAGDVVVWYGLTDAKSQLSGGDETGLYSSIEGDGRNSYYIYNKGNITYTGLGHSKEMTDIEVKLFVNTMISAYRSTAPLAEAIITNEDAVRSGSSTTLYVNTDEENPEINKDLVVNFRIDEQSIGITGRDYVLEYHHKKKDENGKDVLDENGQAIYELENIDTIVTQDGYGQPGTLAQKSGNGNIVYKDGYYYFTVPYDTIKRDGVTEYNLILYSIENGVARAKTTHLTIMQTPLFILN